MYMYAAMASPGDEQNRRLGAEVRTIVVYPGNMGTFTRRPTRKERERLAESFERLWHLNDPEYGEITRGCRSREESVRTARRDPAVEEIHEEAQRARAPTDVAEVLRKLAGVEMPADAMRACRTAAYTSVGNAGESPALAHYAARYGVCVRQPRYRFAMICLVHTAQYVVEVRARVDGLVLVKDMPHPKGDPVRPGALLRQERPADAAEWRGPNVATVVEAKTRTHGLFKGIARNERVQLEMYLQILQANRGVLVERFGAQMMVHQYVRSDDYYICVVSALRRFMDVFAGFLGSRPARRRYVQLHEAARAHAICDMIDGRWPAALAPGGAKKGRGRDG